MLDEMLHILCLNTWFHLSMFFVFINFNYGSELLSARHWYIAEKILEFWKLFYDSTVVLSDVYYPTSPLILHHLLEITSHLHASEKIKI